MKEIKIAKKLVETTDTQLRNSDLAVDIAGVAITFPYHSVSQARYNEYIPTEIWDSYQTMTELFIEGKFPKRWIPIFKEAGKIRERKHCNVPLDLVSAAHFVTLEHLEETRQVGIPLFEHLTGDVAGAIDLRDKEFVIEVIDGIIRVPGLRKALIETAANLLPDTSTNPLNREEAVRLLKTLGINEGICVDLGCGTGINSKWWQEQSGLGVIGVERQYHPEWYDDFWKNDIPNLTFVQTDAAEGLPFPDGSVRVVLMENVIPHVTQEGVEKFIIQTQKVLEKGGWLLVGPQCDYENDDFSGWMIFRKEGTELVQHSLKSLLGEE